jgi:hypothetical protein
MLIFKAARRHYQLCVEHNIKNAPNYSALSMICNKLGAARLLIVESMKKDLQRRIYLHIGFDELTFALHSDPDIGVMVD